MFNKIMLVGHGIAIGLAIGFMLAYGPSTISALVLIGSGAFIGNLLREESVAPGP